jgi:hypothetical protein
MSYEKATKESKSKSKGHKMAFIFSALDANERRKYPLLGSAWFGINKEDDDLNYKSDREKYVAKWEKETEKMLKENPSLKIVE